MSGRCRSRTGSGGRSFSVDAGDGCNEPVAAPGQRFDKPRVVGGVAQRLAQLIDRRIQAAVEIDEGIGGPGAGAKLFPSHHLAGPLK